MFVAMLEQWTWFVLAFSGFLGIGLLIYMLGNRSFKPEGKKQDVYTCGEPFPETGIEPENFYQAIKKNLGLEKFGEAHTGKISDYILWMLVGTVLVISLLIILV